MQDQTTIMVQDLRLDIDRYQSVMLQSGLAANGALCACDLFFWFIAARSAAITSVFADTIENRNHFVSPSLLRTQLSGLLTLYAAQYHEKGPHEFVEEWMKGAAVGQMFDNRSSGGKRMTDGNLLKRIDQELPNAVGSIEKLYAMTSGWVHIDPKFFHSLTQDVGEDGKVQLRLFGPQFDIPQMKAEDEQNWVQSMLSINNLMIAKLLMWAACKQQIWSALTSEEFHPSSFKVDRLEIVGTTGELEAVLLDRGNVTDGKRFLVWINETNPKKNLAYLEFPVREQAETFVKWYLQELGDA